MSSISGGGGGATSLADLSDVQLTTPVADQVLKNNGVNWVNGQGVVANVGPGTVFYLDVTEIIPPGAGPQTFPLESLFKAPVLSGEVDESATVNNSTALIDQYMYDTALGQTINAGEWLFDTSCYVSLATDTSEIIISIGRVIAGTGTIAITGSGTSRTATVTGATPFLAGDFNADITQTGYVITPNAVLRIIGFTSTSVVTVETLSTYTNESGVAYSVDRYLFQATTGRITHTSVDLVEKASVQSAFAINTTDKLSARYYAKTDHIGDVTVHIVHGGSVNYTRFHTPITTLHNDLPGLQGGAVDEDYHSSSAEYTKIQALGSISSQAANNVAITGGSISGITDLPVADGGTGASDAATALSNLGGETPAGSQAKVDTHAAVTASVHNFDASGNAPPDAKVITWDGNGTPNRAIIHGLGRVPKGMIGNRSDVAAKIIWQVTATHQGTDASGVMFLITVTAWDATNIYVGGAGGSPTNDVGESFEAIIF